MSGTFYYNFPRTNFMSSCQPPAVSLSVCETWAMLMEPYIVNKMTSDDNRHMQADVNNCSVTDQPVVSPLAGPLLGRKLLVKCEELLIFMPGFNSCLRAGLNTYGQFLQLAGFPSTITPFLFCWPQVSE